MNLPPDSYLCGYEETCERCQSIGRPVGYTDKTSGDFIQACRTCEHQWVAITAEEEEVAAAERMKDALSTGTGSDVE